MKDPTVEKKSRAAKAAMDFIKPNMCIGLGSGSTSEIALRYIAELAPSMNLCGIPSSEEIASLARSYSIPLKDYSEVSMTDLVIDGADEVDPDYQMIKGGGGALLREKINLLHTKKRIIIVDESKLVNTLGAFPLPLEVNPFGYETIRTLLFENHEISSELRKREDKPFLTDNGNYILDASFGMIKEPEVLDNILKNIPGILETGLFIRLIDVLIIGGEEIIIEKVKS